MTALEIAIEEWQYGRMHVSCQTLRERAARDPNHWLNSTPDFVDADAEPLYRGIRISPDFELMGAQPGMSYSFGPSAFSRDLHIACALSNHMKPDAWVSVLMVLRGKFHAFDVRRHISQKDRLEEVIVKGKFLINSVRTSENDVAGTVLWLGMEPMPKRNRPEP